MHANTSDFHKKITLAGSLIAIGIVFGDIELLLYIHSTQFFMAK